MNAYFAAFGKDEMGKCSAFRLGFMVHYLQLKFKDEWFEWCAKNPQYGDIAHIAAGAAATRWWSQVRAFSDIYRHRLAFAAWC